jgi:hypothetical protein
MALRSALHALVVARVALFTPVHAVKFDLIAGGGGDHRESLLLCAVTLY